MNGFSKIALLFVMTVLPFTAYALEIQPSTPISIQTGSTAYIIIHVNETNEDAAWTVYAECTEGFSQVGGSFQGRGSQSVNIPVVCGGEIRDGTCTVTVTDMNKPEDSDSEIVKVECLPIRFCAPGERQCNGNIIEFCNNNGNGWNTFTTCELGCEVLNNVPSCKTQNQGHDYSWILIILLPVVAIIAIVYWRFKVYKR